MKKIYIKIWVLDLFHQSLTGKYIREKKPHFFKMSSEIPLLQS